MKAIAVLYHSGKYSLDKADYDSHRLQHDSRGLGAVYCCQRLPCTAPDSSVASLKTHTRIQDKSSIGKPY